jgi:hypothetical protein
VVDLEDAVLAGHSIVRELQDPGVAVGALVDAEERGQRKLKGTSELYLSLRQTVFQISLKWILIRC